MVFRFNLSSQVGPQFPRKVPGSMLRLKVEPWGG